MENQLIKIKNNSLIDEESFNSYFDSMVRLTFSEENCQNYLQLKNYYLNSEYCSDFSNKIRKNILNFIEHINNYSNQDNAYLWQEFFIKNENISPVEFVKYGLENVPLVAFFMEIENPVFNRIYHHLRFHKDWNTDIVIGSEYVIAKLVEFNNKDLIECIKKTGFQITDNGPVVYWGRGDKETLKFIFDIKLLDPNREDSKIVTQKLFINMLRKSPSCKEIQDSMDFFENMGVKPDIQTLNFLSKIFNKEYSKSEDKKNVFQKSYFFDYFNKDNNHLIYDSAVAVNWMITDLLDSDEEEADNEETIKFIISFLKDKGIYPDWSDFSEFYSINGEYYFSDGKELQFLKTILIHNSKEYLSKKINAEQTINKKFRL